ncbi:MAG: hypothetical protein OQK73_00240 [Gammaproteobacteria bacterium]|nr:hypothetical protein [Gammaproteobacteria bacterium]
MNLNGAKKRIAVTDMPNGSQAYEESYGEALAHLEIKTITPKNDPLPMRNHYNNSACFDPQ